MNIGAIILFLVVGAASLVTLQTIVQMFRISLIHRLIKRAGDRVQYLALRDIHFRRPWRWRYRELNKISVDQHDKMLKEFWVRPETYWKDAHFLIDGPMPRCLLNVEEYKLK